MANKAYYVSPVGAAVYPKLDKPGKPFKAGDKAKYEIALDFGAKWPEVKADIEALIKELGFKGKARPYKEQTDGRETLIAKSQNKPVLFDANNQKMGEGVLVGGGSKVLIAGKLNQYDKGVNMYLNSVQVISLQERSMESPFAKVAGGYTYEAPEATESFPETDNVGADENDPF
jgi:small nuclear ribonucleoprotein (snRNP)-like protein